MKGIIDNHSVIAALGNEIQSAKRSLMNLTC